MPARRRHGNAVMLPCTRPTGGEGMERSMGFASFARVGAVALLAGSPLAVSAEECPERDAIVKLSDYVLEKRLELPRLQARSFGAEAAYLKIRYAPLEGPAAAELLASL